MLHAVASRSRTPPSSTRALPCLLPRRIDPAADAAAASGHAPGRADVSGDVAARDGAALSAALLASPPTGRLLRWERALLAPTVDVDALRCLAWGGVPPPLRPSVYRLLAGVSSPDAAARPQALGRKRAEYAALAATHCHAAVRLAERQATSACAARAASAASTPLPRSNGAPTAEEDGSAEDRARWDAASLRQIELDAPRSAPGRSWAQAPAVQAALRRLLLVRAMRCPATGYVQGMADLALSLFAVFIAESACVGEESTWAAQLNGPHGGGRPQGRGTDAALSCAEADAFWCFSWLMDGVTDHYTALQPGIQRKVAALEVLVRRLDAQCAAHLKDVGIDYMQFALRWVNCLLQREVPPPLVPRLFDTYFSEGSAFPEFVLYACASFLLRWAPLLQDMDFQGAAMLLQHPPTQGWGEEDVAECFSRAHQYRVLFEGASMGHLT